MEHLFVFTVILLAVLVSAILEESNLGGGRD
jgi:hypothetical protein